MFGLVGCTTMRPMAPLFSSPASFQVSPPSVDLKRPHPGEIVLRESSSPVPAQTCVVSLGAIASSPNELQRWLSNTGRRSEEHTSELQSRLHLVCRLLLEKKKKTNIQNDHTTT